MSEPAFGWADSAINTVTTTEPTPFDLAAAVYDRETCARTFEADLYWHCLRGYVVSTPEAFAMVRLVKRDWPLEWLRDPSRTASPAESDCWWIWLLAGDMDAASRWLPFSKKWLAFEKGNHPRFFHAERFLRLCAGRRCLF